MGDLFSIDDLPAPLRRVIHELRLSERVFRDYGHQHAGKAADATAVNHFTEAEVRHRKAVSNYERADCCKAALDDFDNLVRTRAGSDSGDAK